jgi:hypothetical protein
MVKCFQALLSSFAFKLCFQALLSNPTCRIQSAWNYALEIEIW